MPLPMPLEAPTTRTVLPAKSSSLIEVSAPDFWPQIFCCAIITRNSSKRTEEENNNGPYRLCRSRDSQRAHPRDPRQEPQRQHLSHDVAFTQLLRAVLPARQRDPLQGRA